MNLELNPEIILPVLHYRRNILAQPLSKGWTCAIDKEEQTQLSAPLSLDCNLKNASELAAQGRFSVTDAALNRCRREGRESVPLAVTVGLPKCHRTHLSLPRPKLISNASSSEPPGPPQTEPTRPTRRASSLTCDAFFPCFSSASLRRSL